MPTLAENLKRYRRERGLSQTELAAAAATNQSRVSEIERGETANPSLSRLCRIAAALGVTVDALLENCVFPAETRGGTPKCIRHKGLG